MSCIQNAVKIVEDDIYLMVDQPGQIDQHVFKDGKVLQITGGLEWPERRGDVGVLAEQERYVEYCLSEEDHFDHVAPRMLWRVDADTVKLIKDMSRAELERVIAAPTSSWKQSEVARYWLDQPRESTNS